MNRVMPDKRVENGCYCEWQIHYHMVGISREVPIGSSRLGGDRIIVEPAKYSKGNWP